MPFALPPSCCAAHVVVSCSVIGRTHAASPADPCSRRGHLAKRRRRAPGSCCIPGARPGAGLLLRPYLLGAFLERFRKLLAVLLALLLDRICSALDSFLGDLLAVL